MGLQTAPPGSVTEDKKKSLLINPGIIPEGFASGIPLVELRDETLEEREPTMQSNSSTAELTSPSYNSRSRPSWTGNELLGLEDNFSPGFLLTGSDDLTLSKEGLTPQSFLSINGDLESQVTSTSRISQGANSVTDLLSHGEVGRLPPSECSPRLGRKGGLMVTTPRMVELALLKSVVTGGSPLTALPASSGELFSVPVVSNRFKHTYGQWIVYKLFLEASLKAHQKGARQALLGILTEGYEAFTEFYKWKVPLLDEVGSAGVYEPVLVLIRLDQDLENRMATLPKFVKKTTCPEDRKPLNVIAELYNLGQGGVGSVVLRYYRVPGASKVCVELVATTFTAEALAVYEIFPTAGGTSKGLWLHELDYPAVLIPDEALEGLVNAWGMTWVHKTQVHDGTPPLDEEGQLLTPTKEKEIMSVAEIMALAESEAEEEEEEDGEDTIG